MSTVFNEKHCTGRTPAFHRWRPAAWLRVSGPDAFTFLQGQFTNDLHGTAAGAVYGLWLNQKGRVLADSFVLADGPDAFWVGSYFSTAATIRERLEAYIIADDVSVEDLTAEWSAITWFGADAASQAGVPGGNGVQFAGRRGLERSVEWVYPRGAARAVDDALRAATELDASEVERRRIRARIPAVPVDIGPGELPNEGGLDAGAISYTKGCYLGQEVIARLRTMGQVRRRLLPIRGAGAIPPLPARLFQGDRPIGEVRSAATDADGFAGLALITLLHLRSEEPLRVGLEGACEERHVRIVA